MLALLLLALFALGVALFDDAASGPLTVSSTSTPPGAPAPESGASGPKSGASGLAPTASPAASRSGSADSSTLVVDTVPPLTPTFTQTPPDPSSNATSKFAWTSTDPAPGSGISHYLCSKENGAYVQCASPHTYIVQTTNNGQHQFSVIAVDGAGNRSREAKYKWKVAKGSPAAFTIDGIGKQPRDRRLEVDPGHDHQPERRSDHRDEPHRHRLGGIRTDAPRRANFDTQPAGVPFTVPANAVAHAVPVAHQPRIRLRNLASNQNSCKSQTFTLSFNGSANGP